MKIINYLIIIYYKILIKYVYRKKLKTERTTPEKLRVYVYFVQSHPQLLSGKNAHTFKTDLEGLWNEIADSLNAMRGPTRNAKKWKDVSTVK